MVVTPTQEQGIVPQNGDPMLQNDKTGNTLGFNQNAWEKANPQQAQAEAQRIAANKNQADNTFIQNGSTSPAKTTVRPDGTVVVEGAGNEEDTNRKMAVGKALEDNGTPMPTPPAFNPEIDSTVFGDAALKRQQADSNFLQNRNQSIANSIGTKLGWNNIQNISDSDIKKAIVQDLAQRGAPLHDSRIVDTIYDIQNKIRQGQSGTKKSSNYGGTTANTNKSSNDYFNDLISGIPVNASNIDAKNATQRYAKFSTYSTMTADQLSVSISNNSIIPGDQTWTDLTNAGMGDKLQQAQQLNVYKQSQSAISSVYSVLNTKSDQSLSTQQSTPPQQPDIYSALMGNIVQGMNTNFAALYQQMVVNDPNIAAQRQNVIQQQGQVAEIQNQLTSLQNELKNQIISNGGVVTDGYLASLLAERSQPLQRALATANIQLGVSTNLLNMNMQLAQQTLSFAQQDFENKQASLGLITQIATTQQAQEIQKATAKQVIQPNQFTAGSVYDPITNTFQPLNNQGTGFSGTIANINGSTGTPTYSNGNYDFTGVDNPYFGKNDKTQGVSANRNNPGNIKGTNGDFNTYNTLQEGRDALVNQVEGNRTNYNGKNYNPNMTLTQYFDVYDGKGKGAQYAKNVSQFLGIDINTKIKDIPTQELAKAIVKNEASPSLYNLMFNNVSQGPTNNSTGSYNVTGNVANILGQYGYTDPGAVSAVQAVINGTAPEDSLSNIPGMQRVFPQIKNQIDPTYNASRYTNIQQFKDPNSGIASAISAINTAYEHISDLKNTFGNLNTTQFPWANDKIQDLQKGGFATNPQAQQFLAQYNTIKTFLTDELAKVNVGGSSGLTNADKEATDTIFNSASTPQAFIGQLNAINQLIAGKLGTYAGIWKQNTSAPLNQTDFVKNSAILQNGLAWDPQKGLVLGGTNALPGSTGPTAWDILFPKK